MLDAHVIPPDALYAVSYGSPAPCFRENWINFQFLDSVSKSPSEDLPRNGLQRGKGPWRDPGFWMRLVSPGGTKHLRRRGQTLGRHEELTKTFTLPRKLKYSPTPVTPKKSLSLSIEKENEGHFFSPTALTGWGKASMMSLNERYRGGLWGSTDEWSSPLTPSKSATLPRNIKCRQITGCSPLMPDKGLSSPWWLKVLSPLSPRKVGRKQKSPWSEGTIFEWVEGSEEKKPRGVSLRRLSRTRHTNERPPATSDSNATQSDTEVGKISGPVIRISNGGLDPDTPLEHSRVGSWAVSFEKLIEDPAGLHTFAEFLKKEYSHENIYFWTACERYKSIADEEDRRELAKAIFDRHLGMSASEPVNVDSQARQVAQDGLSNPDEFLFSAAQKQIFNLMKFDSYSRFLKSDLYNKCVTQDRKGLPLPYPGDDSLDPDLGIFSENSFSSHLKKSKSDAEERRRKSLLPWHRKDRSKSKDRGEAEYWRRKKLGHRTPSESSSARYDLSDSHTSLSSSDFAPGNKAVSKESLTSGEAVSLSGSEGLSLCRFILPDQSNSVLAVRSGETVKELVRQLLDRRRINFTEFNVVLTKGNKIVDLNKDSTVLGGHEARLERMVLFSLYLPSRKTVIVKAKPHKLVTEVLKPILSKYGLKLDLMVIHKYGDSKGINIKGSVTDLDGEKLIVQTKEEVKEWSEPGRAPKRNNTLDEITNKVFEDLLNGKTRSSFDDLGVLDFDSRSTKTDPTSDTSSLIGSFGRRESLSLERNLPSRQSGCGRGLLNDSAFSSKRNVPPPPYNVKSKQENADLYEGLKRAQMYRLDDQRGTEINFELPEFLKSDRGQGTTLLSHFDHSFHSNSSDGTEQSEFLSRAHPEVWGGVQGSPTVGDNTLIAPADLDLDDLEETLRPMEHDKLHDVNNSCNNNNNSISNNNNSGVPSQSPFLTPPPPLPPKPKLGGALRGPPPRPPSRQLPSLSHSLHLLDVPMHMAASRPSLSDKLSVSFV